MGGYWYMILLYTIYWFDVMQDLGLSVSQWVSVVWDKYMYSILSVIAIKCPNDYVQSAW